MLAVAAGGWLPQPQAPRPGQGLRLRLGSKMFTKGDDLFQHFSMVRLTALGAPSHDPRRVVGRSDAGSRTVSSTDGRMWVVPHCGIL